MDDRQNQILTFTFRGETDEMRGSIRSLLYTIAYYLFRVIFALRYKISYVGLDKVQKALDSEKKDIGTLFFPNHPAVVVDPLMIALPLLAPFSVRPLITEYMYYNPLFHPILKWIRALPVPNFAVGVNPLKIDRLEKTLKIVESGLVAGDSFLLYPAGMTKGTSREIIGGAFAAYDLCNKYPEANVVLIRTTGLWGSRFSRAFTNGNQVDMSSVLRHAFSMIMRSALFFLPKRTVRIEFEIATIGDMVFAGVNLPISKGRMEFNRALERWYNMPFEDSLGNKSGEPLYLVRESAWSEELPIITTSEVVDHKDIFVDKEIEEKVVAKIAELAAKSKEVIHFQDHLVADVGLDSLNIAELIAFIEVHYDQRGINPQEMTTVLKACLYASGKLELEREQVDPPLDTSLWEKPREVTRLFIPEADTLVDAFLTTAAARPNEGIAGDAKAGIVQYKKMRKAIYLLAREIARYEGETIGILLPASVAANLLILASQLAGKVPVMINWTVGGRHLESVVEHSKITTVLTSWSFLDRLENVDLSPLKELIVVLEERKASFLWWNYIVAAVADLFPWGFIKRYTSFFPEWHKLQNDSSAVILFTSGTESMPKGVPLTHHNILSNIQAALHSIELFSSDRVLGMLPPFHSFGFTVTGLMPLIAGMRVYYSPNPLDAPRLAHSIRYWKITLLCSAPSFLKNILRQTINNQPFESVRALISGAERVPDDLHALMFESAPQASFIEGYGITECSPILTINSQGRGYGVGKPMNNVRLEIVDPEDYNRPKELGQPGMILVSGPNIFQGYLQKNVSSPFWNKEAHHWYITGDIGCLDSLGNLHITGRLKRFVKVGGEMVSLGAIEEAIEKSFASYIPNWSLERAERMKKRMKTESRPMQDIATSSFSVIAKGEEEGRAKLILFSLFPVEQVEVNMALRKSGFSNLVKIDRVVQIDEFPLMGTGKIAFRQLEDQILLA